MGITGVLLYMGLLGFGAVITPHVGMAGSLLAICPQPIIEFAHIPAYGLLTWLLTSGLRERGWPESRALWVGVIGAWIFGVWMETLQAFVPGRFVELGDVASNTIGIAVAALWIRFSPEREAFAKRPLHLVK